VTSDIELHESNTEITEEPKRSYKYMQIFTELKHWRGGAYNIAKRLYDQGKTDGLSNELIRSDIETVLNGVVTTRQINRALPEELKRSGGYDSKPRKDIMSIQNKTPAQAAMEFKNQSQQLATDSISKTIPVESPTTIENPSMLREYSNEDIDHKPDQSEVYGLPQNYEIENVPSYDRSHLIKIVQYLHNEVAYYKNNLANVIPSAVDDKIAQQQIQQLQEQVKQLTEELGSRKETSRYDNDMILQLKVQLKKAGLTPDTRPWGTLATSTTSTTTSAAEA
jgi:hypothetical protein